MTKQTIVERLLNSKAISMKEAEVLLDAGGGGANNIDTSPQPTHPPIHLHMYPPQMPPPWYLGLVTNKNVHQN